MPITTFNNIKYLNMNLAKKTRFRVMCNKDLTFPKWQADAISLLMSHNEISCELVIVNAEVSSHNFLSRILQLSFRTLFWFEIVLVFKFKL